MGVMFTYLHVVIILSYFCLKMIFLVNGQELIVTQSIELDSFDPLEPIDLKDQDFNFAFVV